MIVLDSEYVMCIDNNGEDTKQTRNISRRINFLRNGENYKMNKIDWFEEGILLADIITNNVVKHDLTPRIKYIMVILDN